MIASNNSAIVVAPPDERAPAHRLGEALGLETSILELASFPDGETKIRAPAAAETTLLYWSLDQPNKKIMPLVLAASALRDIGAKRIILIAPYLCYMRQDKAFREGEPVSQRVLARILSQWVDHLITVEPHIHRAPDLTSIFDKIDATNVSAAPLLSSLIEDDGANANAALIGPDAESFAWTETVAAQSGLPFAVMSKVRLGDHKVDISYDDKLSVEGKKIYLIDDLISSGGTLLTAAALLRERAAAQIEALVVHALCDASMLDALESRGVDRIRSLDTAPHPTNARYIAPLLAETVRSEIKL
ncbi:MAG: ribose-phosphate diphosphokinase [Pseudomonadota bacterium]